MREIKPGYFVIAEYGRYAVIKRETDFQPYIVANNLQDDGSWDYGHYFSDLFEAVDYARSHADEKHISYRRMREIASRAVDGIYESNDPDPYDYCADIIKMTDEEMELFGVEPNYEVELNYAQE